MHMCETLSTEREEFGNVLFLVHTLRVGIAGVSKPGLRSEA